MTKLLLLIAILAYVTLIVSSETSTSRDKNSSEDANCSDDDGDVNTNSCGANETFVDCPDAECVPRRCAELGQPISCPAQPEDGSCPGQPGCVCIDGFVRNENNVCIPTSDCPSCGGDENKRVGCGVYCNNHCSDIDEEPKACIAICYFNACDCKEGYYLNSDGKCVTRDQCNKIPTCKKNEVFSNCTNGGCDARNCSQLGTPVPCVKLDPAACKRGCVCVDGYLRAKNGICVPKSQCPSCGGDPNAKSGCGVNCGKRCSTYKSKNPICPKICRVNGCDCKDGYVFDDNIGICVIPKDCTPTCQVNEVFSNCTNGGCDARNCSQLGTPVPCVKLDPAACKRGCVCVDGYLRAKNGTCVPKSECPTCGGDPNAKPGCGIHCGRRCSTYKSKQNPLVCPRICLPNSCDCKDKYVYDDNLQKCVLPKDCTPTCQVNEVFSNCTNGGCDSRNCSQLGTPVPCVKLDPAACKRGCVCVDGYLRAKNGTCVPKSECPSCGDDPNAKPGCGVHCGNTCSTYKNKPVACPLICMVDGCDCKKNYVYDTKTKKCVLPKDCSKSSTTTPCPTTTSKPSTASTSTTVAPSSGHCSNGDAQECLTEGNIDFTVNFLYEMIKVNAGKSIVMSPFSCFIPLAELALYSQPGDSYNQLMSALNLNNKDQIKNVFPALLSALKSQANALLDLAAKIYVNQDAKLTEDFENNSLQIFGAKAENVDFSKSQNAADIINAWVEEVTRGLIQNLVSPDMFSSDTRLVLVNAIYFLGNWQTQFNPNDTQTSDFNVNSDSSIQVPMMYRKGKFKFAESSSLNCKILEIPYKNENMSYVIFLPNDIEGYTDLADKLRNTDVLNKALDSLTYQTCLLYLPRHDISSTIDLTSILAKLKITGIFDDSTANLSGILEGSEQLSVTAAIQKAKINVTEVGTEAAAANAFTVGVTSVIIEEIIYTVKADHPFLYFLLVKRDPLFCGVYAGN